ncbi:MAG: hypothetical protein KAH32_02900 [Chlamydiia bacterium]|nr:hypothetical protein [Chlamydiia bacterium]
MTYCGPFYNAGYNLFVSTGSNIKTLQFGYGIIKTLKVFDIHEDFAIELRTDSYNSVYGSVSEYRYNENILNFLYAIEEIQNKSIIENSSIYEMSIIGLVKNKGRVFLSFDFLSRKKSDINNISPTVLLFKKELIKDGDSLIAYFREYRSGLGVSKDFYSRYFLLCPSLCICISEVVVNDFIFTRSSAHASSISDFYIINDILTGRSIGAKLSLELKISLSNIRINKLLVEPILILNNGFFIRNLFIIRGEKSLKSDIKYHGRHKDIFNNIVWENRSECGLYIFLYL